MSLQLTPYAVPLALVVGLCVVGAAIAWHQRDGPAEVWAMLIQVSIGLWALTNLLTLSFTSLSAKLWSLLLFVPTIPLLVTTTFLFTLHFVGLGRWLTPARRAVLLAFPVVVLLGSLTNGAHELLLVNPTLDTSGAFVRLAYGFGPGMYAVAGVSYVVSGLYLGLMARKFRRSRNVYRKLSLVIFLTAFVLMAITLGSFARVSPVPHFLLLPYSYLVMGVLLLVGTSSARLIRHLPGDRVLAPIRSRVDSTVPLARDFVMQEVDNGIIVLDAEDRVVDINTTAKRMLGLERPVGRRVTEFTRPSLVLEGEELLPVLRGTEPVRELHDEVWVETPDGERCYDVTFSALADDGSEDAAHVVLLHDITERKAREEQLQRQTEALETQTAQLEHQNERLDEFAGIVSHDLRNPLNVASGRIELLLATNDGPEVTVPRAELAGVQDAHDRMEAIIEDALALARQGKAITETEPVELGRIARTAWENVDTGATTLAVDCTGTVDADRDRLLNVFENLFRNAVEHGSTSPQQAGDAVEHGSTSNRNAVDSGDAVEHGSTSPQQAGDAVEHGSRTETNGEQGSNPPVTVTVGDIDGDSEVGFYVADDGPGIPETERETVLEHGYTTSESGTGLGLSIVTDIATAHGWEVSVTESEAGGARFEMVGVERAEPAQFGD